MAVSADAWQCSLYEKGPAPVWHPSVAPKHAQVWARCVWVGFVLGRLGPAWTWFLSGCHGGVLLAPTPAWQGGILPSRAEVRRGVLRRPMPVRLCGPRARVRLHEL